MTNITLNKSDLIDRMASKNPHIDEMDRIVSTMIEQMVDCLAKGNRIEIRGFGSFSLHHREPRKGRNPRTGDEVMIASKAVPHFKPGKALRDSVNASVQQKTKK